MRLNIFSQEGLLFESVVDELSGMQRSKDAYSGVLLKDQVSLCIIVAGKSYSAPSYVARAAFLAG